MEGNANAVLRLAVSMTSGSWRQVRLVSVTKIMEIDDIRYLISRDQYELSIHAQQERLEDDLDVVEIETALMQGELLEDYPEDPRGESCLVLGYAGTKPIHAVIGWAKTTPEDEKILRIITVYIPQPPRWRDPWTRGSRV